uniref:hypothetical protein n=1 Tax=Bombilactobacillus bombi TaxID=1303590 RepID=UPI001C63B6D8|nr:hypothetical protein [Bombilactobacillus bombi]
MWQQIITPLYDQFVPAKIRNRRNVRQAKLSDIELLALPCYQTELVITNQRRYYRFLTNLHCVDLPEGSRFNRLSNRGWQLLQLMRTGLVKQVSQNTRYTIIDSLPLSVCQSVRN